MLYSNLQLMALRDHFRMEEEDSTDWRIAGGKCRDFSEYLVDMGIVEGEVYEGWYVPHNGPRIGHAWIQVDADTILDATADQFGIPGGVVIVSRLDAEWQRYIDGEKFVW